MTDRNNKKPGNALDMLRRNSHGDDSLFLRPDFQWGVLLFLIALAIRIAFYFILCDAQVFAKYTVLAREMANGADLGQRLLDVSPFYLSLLGALAKIAPRTLDYLPFIQLVAGALVCLLIYALGLRLFTRQVGFAAGLIYAMYGNGMILESTLEPYVFVLLFNGISIYLLTRAAHGQEASPWLIAGAGIFSGLSVLAKPNFILFIIFACVWIHFALRNSKIYNKANLYPLLYIITAMMVIAPVTVRNYVKFNDFVLVTADYGKVFFHGNAGATTVFIPQYLPGQDKPPAGELPVDYAHVVFRKKASELAGRPLSPSEAARFWTRFTLADFKKHPWKHVQLEGRKLALFFHNFEIHHIQANHYRYVRSLGYPFVGFGLIASLGLLGMVLCLKQGKRFALLYGVVGVYLVSGLIFVVNSRYRAPAVPYLCLFAGAVFHYTAAFFVERKNMALAASLLALACLLALTHWTYADQIKEYMGAVLSMYPDLKTTTSTN
ncbi:MAG: glycosyltransferase family 39 protein [Desulfatibacillum sp.]|nr:glycosyltransferase family 39 protein [Desulfatibacillum sp.]